MEKQNTEDKELDFDVHVVFDPILTQPIVPTQYTSQKEDGNTAFDSTKTDGIEFPIVYINDNIVFGNEVEYMKIWQDDFLPTMTLSVIDTDRNIQKNYIQGMDNRVTIIMLAPLNNVLRKIKVTFYVTSQDVYDTSIILHGVMYIPTFEKVIAKSYGKLSTYDFLYKVCKDSGVGFSCTDNCDTVSDERTRLVTFQKFKDVIQQHVEFGGDDDSSLMLCWVDLYGYLNLVNIGYLIYSNVSPEDIQQSMISGIKTTESDIDFQNASRTYRIITNLKDLEASNVYFSSYNSKMSNSSAYRNGTIMNCQSFGITGSGLGSNDISNITMATQDNTSAMSNISKYSFESQYFLGVEMDQDNPFLVQKQLNKKVREQLKSNLLEVEMGQANLSLLKGMLVCVSIFDYSQITQGVAERMDNDGTQDAETNSAITDQPTARLNEKLSGLYYIQSIEYMYDFTTNGIQQKLFLFKR